MTTPPVHLEETCPGYRIRPVLHCHQAGERIEAAYAWAGPHLRASPHCLGFEPSHCVGDPTQCVLRIEWTSVDEHLQGVRKSAQFAPFPAAVRPYVEQIVEMRHYAVKSASPSATAER